MFNGAAGDRRSRVCNGEQISDEHLGEFWFFVEQAHHHLLIQTHNSGALQSTGGGNSRGLRRQAPLAKEIALVQDCDYRFFTPFGSLGWGRGESRLLSGPIAI